jgi:hypothetical protein
MLELGGEDKINHLTCFEEGLKWLWLVKILRRSRFRLSFNPKVKIVNKGEILRSLY